MGEPDELRAGLQQAWHRFVDRVEPERPALHRYCRHLARDVWDAEDLVQDTLLRAFGTLGKLDEEVRNPRAYLFRLATNCWIDALRRRATAAALVLDAPEPGPQPDAARALRDAGAELWRLAPQERAAVVLREAFEMSSKEIAQILGTSEGAVKSALHRGRERLRQADPAVATSRSGPPAELLDRFVAAFNAANLEAVLELVLDHASVDLLGCAYQVGPDSFRSEKSWFRGALFGHSSWPPEFRFDSQRAERATFQGESIALVFRTRKGEEALESVIRLDEEDGRVRHVRSYSFCPETLREVGEQLGLPVRARLYRYPTPVPGGSYGDPNGEPR